MLITIIQNRHLQYTNKLIAYTEKRRRFMQWMNTRDRAQQCQLKNKSHREQKIWTVHNGLLQQTKNINVYTGKFNNLYGNKYKKKFLSFINGIIISSFSIFIFFNNLSPC